MEEQSAIDGLGSPGQPEAAVTGHASASVVVAHGNAGTWRLVKEEDGTGLGTIFHIELLMGAPSTAADGSSWQRVPMAEAGTPYEDMLRTFVGAWIRQHRLAERFELA